MEEASLFGIPITKPPRKLTEKQQRAADPVCSQPNIMPARSVSIEPRGHGAQHPTRTPYEGVRVDPGASCAGNRGVGKVPVKMNDLLDRVKVSPEAVVLYWFECQGPDGATAEQCNTNLENLGVHVHRYQVIVARLLAERRLVHNGKYSPRGDGSYARLIVTPANWRPL